MINNSIFHVFNRRDLGGTISAAIDDKLNDSAAGIRRKVRAIMEIRYPAVPSIFDTRGKIIESIYPRVKDDFKHWNSDLSTVVFSDDPSRPQAQMIISHNRSAVTLEDFEYLREFVVRTERYLRLIYEHLGPSIKRLPRMGVRLIEVCIVPSAKDFDDALRLITSKLIRLPDDLPLDMMDSLITITHKHGHFVAGPVRAGEQWVQASFSSPERNVPEFGLGLDIDSYAADLSSKNPEEWLRSFQAVYRLTKEVEETLLGYLGLINAQAPIED